jgi:glycosyltransferase involved in cell wall biosynthesis
MKNDLSITVLSVPPLSQLYIEKIIEKKNNNKLEKYCLGELRRLSIIQIFKLLFNIKSDILFLAYEDTSSAVLESFLGLMSLFTRAKTVKIINENLEEFTLRKTGVFRSVWSLIIGSIYAHINMIKCYLELKKLAKKERLDYKIKNKQILYLKTNLWFGVKVGGSIGHISGVINGFIKKGYSVDYISMEEPIMLDSSVKSIRVPSMQRFGLPQEANLYSFQKHFFEDIQKIDLGKYGFIYSRMSMANYVNILLSIKLRIPLILEYNGSEVWVQEKWGSGIKYKFITQLAEDMCLKFAHQIVVVSEVLKNELLDRGVEPHRITFYPNCIDPEVFDPNRFNFEEKIALRKRYDVKYDDVLLTFVGTFGQWHGAERFAKAINLLVNSKRDWLIKHKVKFLFVGDGLKMPNVKHEIANELCKPFVVLAGLVPQKEAPLHLAASDILVSPHVANVDGSDFFGSPTKLFEYMAMGKGIIASDLNQIGEVLRNSIRIHDLPQYQPIGNETQLALLTEPGDVDLLANAIVFMVENSEWRTILGVNAQKQAYSKYTWQNHVEVILEEFKKCVG